MLPPVVFCRPPVRYLGRANTRYLSLFVDLSPRRTHRRIVRGLQPSWHHTVADGAVTVWLAFPADHRRRHPDTDHASRPVASHQQPRRFFSYQAEQRILRLGTEEPELRDR